MSKTKWKPSINTSYFGWILLHKFLVVNNLYSPKGLFFLYPSFGSLVLNNDSNKSPDAEKDSKRVGKLKSYTS